MKKTILAICISILVFASLKGQTKKDSTDKTFPNVENSSKVIPLPDLPFTAKVTPQQWHLIDSIFQKTYFWIGKSMTVDAAEPLKNQLSEVYNFFAAQMLPDSVKNKTPIKPQK